MTGSDNLNLQDWQQLHFLTKVTDTAPSVIYIFNRRTQSNEYANRSLGASLGYSVQEVQEMGDALLPTLIHPEDLQKVGPHFEVLRTLPDGEVAQLEYRVKHKDGGWVWLLAYETVFERDEAGEVIRHLGVATDITLQKLAQETALAERRVADAANDELRSLAYSISHDLKSPSNTLHLLLSEMEEQHGKSFDEDATQLLNMSLKTVNRMQRLVDDVLSYTRVIEKEIKNESVDLNKLVDKLLTDLKDDIDQAKADVHVAELPTIRGHENQVRMLFKKLIGNALMYRNADVKTVISVKSSPHMDEGMVNIHIADNGIGIAPRHQQKIFEMFKRLHGGHEFPGTGLGLTICRRIVLNHGGSLVVHSESGAGAEFIASIKSR